MSESTALPNACPKCGAALPADAAEGLCPRCLMAEAMLPTGPKKAWEPPTAAELGELLPEYDIEKLLGRGGMGAVYKGRQKSLDRPVAIKILSSTLDESDQGFAERFKNEARALGKLKHPGIVGVYDFGAAADGLLYIVMEFIDGTDVAKMIAKSGRLHTEHAMAITAHVCDALAYAHERGIIHRDIKPANIMVGYDGVVQVADFGLAKMTHSQNTGLTQSGMAMGTLHYMAPESLMLGTSVDHRADIYAVGVMLYQMLTGKLPQGLFNMPSLQIKGLDPRYDRIIGKALMEDREERYQSVTEMRMGLDEILTQPVVKAEAGAGKTPAALNTQARPKRPGGPENPEDHDDPSEEYDEVDPVEKRTSPWLWVVLIAILALGGWEFLRKRQITLDVPPEIPVSETTAGTSLAPEPKPAAIPPASVAPATAAPTMTPAATAPAVASKVPPSASPTPAVPPATPPAPSIPTGPTRTSIERIEGENMTVLNLSAGSIEKQDMAFWFKAGTCSGGWLLHWINDVKDATLTLRLPVKTAGMARLRAVLITSYDYGIVEVRLDGRILPGAPFNLYQRGTTVTDILDWGIHDLTAGDHEIALKVIGAVVNSQGLHAGLDYVQIEPLEAADRPPTAKPGVNIAPLARPSASHCHGGDTVAALNDQKEPQNNKSLNTDIPRHTFYDHLGSHEWVQYEWETPQYINESSVFWYEDNLSNTGSASLPFFWRLLYRDETGAWVPVEARIPDAKIDQWNTVKFPTVKTRGLRLAVQSKRDLMSGILEWKAAAADPNSILPVRKPQPDLYLGDLTPVIASSSWPYAVGLYYSKDITKNQSKVLRIDGEDCDRYLLTHTPSHLEFVIPKGYTRFKATGFAPFDTATNKPIPGDWIYRVEVDDEVVFESQELRTCPNYQVPIEVPLPAGSKRLVLKTISSSGDQNGHSLWGYPTLVSDKSSSMANTPTASGFSPVATASKVQPFVNTLGMNFVSVPGTNVLFCIHETRREDYAAYADNTPGADVAWKTQSRYGVPCGDKPGHPVVGVTWEHAQQFCRWLSEKEGKTYRLPTDQEWSVAVGLGADETRLEGSTPQSLSGKQTTEFPWGRNYPPLTPDKAGNYADAAWLEKWPDEPAMPGLADGFPTTAPVMSFKPNKLGLYDMGGNVWEWVDDWANEAQKDRVLRGGAFTTFDKAALSSARFIHTPEMGYYYDHGFRVVLELDGAPPLPPSALDTSSALGAPPNITRRVIDLIKTVSLLPDSRRETWESKGTDLEFLKGGEIIFPHACGTQEYDLEFDFTVLTEEVNSIVHTFPTAKGRCILCMQLFREHPGPFWGFGILDDVHYAFAKAARVVKDYPPLFEAGKRYQTIVKVRDGSLEAYLNGRLLVHWEGDQSRFTTGETNLPHPRHPKFGIYDGRAIIHKATVTEFVPTPASPPAPSVALVTKEQPFVNSLGMKFLPVTIEGGPTSDKRVLFSVWHTRVQDYKVFVEETKRGWPGAGFAQAPTHPAVLVSWEDAKVFCAWMTQRDRTAGKIRPNDGYRLPTDHEWSCAVGLGAREDWTLHPAEKNSKVRGVFPWGTQWPPPQGAGNYAGEELQQALKTARFPDVHGVIAGFNDGFETTAPVGSFAANSLGLHDMGGNVWSWCEDWSDKDQKHRVLRGGSWITHLDVVLLSSNRGYIEPLGRFHDLGFRLVLEIATTPQDASSNSSTHSQNALLEQQYQAAIVKQVTPGVDAYAKKLLTSYRSALERSAKAPGMSASEAEALKAEITRVTKEASMPAADAPGISVAIASLRSTYRKALEDFRLEKTAPLKAVYDKQRQAQTRMAEETQKLPPGPSPMPPDGSTSSPRAPTMPTAEDYLSWRQVAERLLALKAELTIAEGNRAQSVRKIEELPAGPFMLHRIWLIDSAVTDDVLAMLAGSSELSVVNIDGSSVTRFPFAELPGLEFFHYNRGLCTDDTLEGIENCQRLTELFISGSKLSKTSLRRLKNCPKLERLCLSATNIDSDDLKELGQLNHLKHVDLSHTQTTGRGLSELQGLSLLEALVITHLDLTGSNLDFLSNFKNLNKLTANSTKFDDKHFLLIGGLKALKGLDLEDVQMNDRHVATISQCLSLEELVVPRTEITGTGFSAVAEWPSLARLNLAGTRLSKDGLRSVTETCPHLTELTIPAAPLSADNMARLSKLTKLKSLEIQDGRFDRTWVPFMERMDQLEWLHLTRTTVSDADVAAIAKLTRLTRLGLTGTQITDACIPDLMKLKSLSELWLSGTAITEAGRAKLKDLFQTATIHQ